MKLPDEMENVLVWELENSNTVERTLANISMILILCSNDFFDVNIDEDIFREFFK